MYACERESVGMWVSTGTHLQEHHTCTQKMTKECNTYFQCGADFVCIYSGTLTNRHIGTIHCRSVTLFSDVLRTIISALKSDLNVDVIWGSTVYSTCDWKYYFESHVHYFFMYICVQICMTYVVHTKNVTSATLPALILLPYPFLPLLTLLACTVQKYVQNWSVIWGLRWRFLQSDHSKYWRHRSYRFVWCHCKRCSLDENVSQGNPLFM